MVDMVAKAKALILGLLASAATTAATIDLTLPPGDYMLVPVQPYTVVTIQSQPIDPPVEPEPEPEPPAANIMGPIFAPTAKFADYYQPAYDTPEDAWQMITDMCGPVGSWDHEIEIVYGQEPDNVDDLRLRYLDGCIHVKGVPGPNGELPRVGTNSTKGYYGTLRRGGIFIENIAASAIGVPNDQHFLVLHNVDLREWGGHALITSDAAKHLYLEVKDSYIGQGNSNHALYIDNIAFAYIEGNTIESPGQQHGLRVIAQGSVIRNNKLCSIQCDGTITVDDKGRSRIGTPVLDIYVNGSHLVENNEIVYYRKHKDWALMAANFRKRPAIHTLDRYRVGDHYEPILWGTEKYNDPDTWENMPMIETVVKNMAITCLGESPCYGWMVESTYPVDIDNRMRLTEWWQAHPVETWPELLETLDPSWHATMNLMTDDYREYRLDRPGVGLQHAMPLAVPDGWRQKARITFDNVTGNFEALLRPWSVDSWCQGKMENDTCVDGEYYNYAETIIVGDQPEPHPDPEPQPPTDWAASLLPYVPPVGELRTIPNTALTPVLLQDDGTPACKYLKCSRSGVGLQDWVGMSFDDDRGIARLVAMGGHADLGANSVYEFDVSSLTWARVFDYAQPKAPFPHLVDADGNGILDCTELEQGPMGTHSYDGLVYVPSKQASLLLRVTGYTPKNPVCERRDMNGNMALWHDDGGYEFTSVPGVAYPRAAYDKDRDRIYYIAAYPLSGMYELDPTTWETKKIYSTYAGSGGTMTMEGRWLYYAERGIGVSRVYVDLDGTFRDGEKLVPEGTWDNSYGLAVSNGVVVGWDGKNTIVTHNTATGETTKTEAPGDVPTAGVNGYVYGKWQTVMPGVFIGLASNEGWVIYRAF